MINSTLLNQAIMQTLQKNGLSQYNMGKSIPWQTGQIVDARNAAQAGLPSFSATPESSASRLRLIDAINRSISSGQDVPHFIGTPTEPTGDRGVTMDIESLVSSLKAQEQNALNSGDKIALDKISKERAYWEDQARQGMSAEEWRAQTGQGDPIRGLQFLVGLPDLRQ